MSHKFDFANFKHENLAVSWDNAGVLGIVDSSGSSGYQWHDSLCKAHGFSKSLLL